MTRRLRLAIIGCGVVAHERHVPGLGMLREAGIDRCEIVACCDAVEANAASTAERAAALGLGTPRVYESWEQVIADGIAEAVDVCLPHGLHHVCGIAALAAGQHVFMEKPLAVTIRTGRLLCEAADRAGRVLATGVPYRRALGQRAVRWALEAGLIGLPQLYLAAYAQHRPVPPAPNSAQRWRRDRSMGGGGSILDAGEHFYDSARCFFGEVTRVHAVVRADGSVTANDIFAEREQSALVTLEHAGGVVGSWSWTYAYPGHEHKSVLVYGTEGSIADTGTSDPFVIYHPFLDELELRRGDGSALDATALRDGYRAAIGEDEWARLFPGGVTYPFALELHDFLGAVLEGLAPEVDGWDGLRTLAVAEAIYQSSVSGQSVLVDDVLAGRSGDLWQAEIDNYWLKERR